MAWNAGAIYGTAKLDDKKWSKGLGKMKAGAAVAFTAIAAGFTAITVQAEKFEKAFANVRSITEDTFGSISQLRGELLTLNPELGATAELTKGVYQAFSSGAGTAEKAMAITTESAKLGKAVLTDTASAVDIVTTAINAYGEETVSAEKAADLFFNTVKNGKITGEQLAATIGQSIPMFASMGVSMEDLTAGMIALTKQGVQASETTTQMNAVVRAFVKPSREMQEALKAAGKESGAMLLKTEGLAGAIDFLNKETNGNQEAMAKLVPNIRGLKGVMGLTAQDGKLLAEALESTKNAAGGANEAFETQEKTFATLKNATGQLLTVTGQLSRGLTVELASSLTDTITGTRDFVNEIRAAFDPSEDLRQSTSLLNKYLKQQEQVNADLSKAQNKQTKETYKQLKAQQAMLASSINAELYESLAALKKMEKQNLDLTDSKNKVTSAFRLMGDAVADFNTDTGKVTNLKEIGKTVKDLEGITKQYAGTLKGITGKFKGDKIYRAIAQLKGEWEGLVYLQNKGVGVERLTQQREKYNQKLREYNALISRAVADTNKGLQKIGKTREGIARTLAIELNKDNTSEHIQNMFEQLKLGAKNAADPQIRLSYKKILDLVKSYREELSKTVEDTDHVVEPLKKVNAGADRLNKTAGELEKKTWLEGLIAQLIETDKKFKELGDDADIDVAEGKFDAFVGIIGVMKDEMGLTRKQAGILAKVLNKKLPEGAEISQKHLSNLYKKTSDVDTILDRVGDSIDRADKRLNKLGEQAPGIDTTGKKIEGLEKNITKLREAGFNEDVIVNWLVTTLRYSKEAEIALKKVFPDAPETKALAEKSGTAWVRELVSNAEKGIKPLKALLSKGLISEENFERLKTKKLVESLMPLKDVYQDSETAINKILKTIQRLNPELDVTRETIKSLYNEAQEEDKLTTSFDNAKANVEKFRKQFEQLKKQLPPSIGELKRTAYTVDQLSGAVGGVVKAWFKEGDRKEGIKFIKSLGVSAEVAAKIWDEKLYPSVKKVNSILGDLDAERKKSIKKNKELNALGIESNQMYRDQEKQLLSIAKKYDLNEEGLRKLVERYNKLHKARKISDGQLKESIKMLKKHREEQDKDADKTDKVTASLGDFSSTLASIVKVIGTSATFKGPKEAALTFANVLVKGVGGAFQTVGELASLMLENERAIMEKEIQGLEKQIAVFDKRIAKSQEKATALRADISDIENELAKLTDADDRSRGEKLKDELDELKEQLDRELNITAEQYDLMLEDEEAYTEGSLEIKLNNYDKEKELDENLNNEKIQNIRELMDAKQAQLNNEISILQKEKLAKEEALKEEQDAEAKAQKKKEAREAKIKKKQNAMAKKSFEAEKANAIAGIWTSAAESILGFWSAMAGFGPPGWITAGAMTGVVTGLAATQTALVAGQEFVKPYPGYAKGVRNAPGGEAIVGEEGPEKLVIPKGSHIKNATETSRELGRMGNTRNINVNTYIQDPVVRDDTDINRIVEMVNTELGHRLGVAI